MPKEISVSKDKDNSPVQGMASFTSELRKLKPRTRNQVRGILAADVKDSIRLIDLLRKNSSAKELLQIERVLCAHSKSAESIIPVPFPNSPQTGESYHRLSTLSFTKQLEAVDALVSENKVRLYKFLDCCSDIGVNILNGDLGSADQAVGETVSTLGHSHFLLRKAVLIRALNSTETPLPLIDKLLDDAGVGTNNIITSSLIQCYQEEQDFLSMKRSIMNLPNKGKLNQYTRDITRLPFHPHAKDEHDLCEMMQSNLQSSLIDVLILIKINRRFIDETRYKNIFSFLSLLDTRVSDIDDIAKQYMGFEDGEVLFYKHSSAWLENIGIVKYRLLQDHFYDDPESTYFKINEPLIECILKWVADIHLADLVNSQCLTLHSSQTLKVLENDGCITKSSMFNFLVHRCEGYSFIQEDDLFQLMGQTRDLAKTINAKYIRTLAKNVSSKLSQILFYLLIARKSKNEADNHCLRRLLQQIIKSDHKGSLVDFIAKLGEKSQEVAQYAYDVCTEDFISKLSHIIFSAAEITETRAALHKWMGETTGEKSFLDRARTLLIDHQINRIRDEIDDNRIYVDVGRFSEWINDELMRELDAVLTGMKHKNTLDYVDEPQLLLIIERAYSAFCGNNIFGIASYLGRRIRHGTFKGHLYSSVISIENQYVKMFKDPVLLAKWTRWKAGYESCVDGIITNRLHVESSTKRDGLLKPQLKGAGKSEIAIACAQNLVKDYLDKNNSAGAIQILTEYCWRLAEVDLKNVNAFLKGQKSNLIKNDFLNDFKLSSNSSLQELAKDFTRDLQRIVGEKLIAMYGWFKRPLSVSPKASLSLLYKAVVTEVKETFPYFEADTNFDEDEDIELVGGPYHVLYDAFYVVVYNAAKHGKCGGKVERKFSIQHNSAGRCIAVTVTITSSILDHQNEEDVNKCLKLSPEDDIPNAQLSEGRSGIRKLHHLAHADSKFSIVRVACENRRVIISVSYALEH